tara:strand:- start:934 stop:1359 length:426 start_codon:yes stop_codon:yes gene_type:complete
MNTYKRFHLAFPVNDLNITKYFYGEILNCQIGRDSERWVDFNFYGHQIVAHLAPDECKKVYSNIVDEDQIPCRHFGVILDWFEWEELSKKLSLLKINFLIKPKVRFKNKLGEQGTFFLKDPSGNVLEFKTFKNDTDVFKKF